ncbi:MAG: precorrin-8X methylmutase [Pseudanabaenaceae cyanobacterium]|jgi:precorrin-8X/cobalt-precorrin-8 methylmutase
MEWHVTDAQSLAIIDQEFGDHNFSPAEYEIIRQVIYATADFDYQHLLRFSSQSLQLGSAALAARTTVIVDVPPVQAAILPKTRSLFSNPIYCGTEAITRPQTGKSQAAWGIETLARRYPGAIFVIGQAQTALGALVDLVEIEEVQPALIIAAPACFVDGDSIKERLAKSAIPHIYLEGRKGNSMAAAAIFTALLSLAWQAYGNQD